MIPQMYFSFICFLLREGCDIRWQVETRSKQGLRMHPIWFLQVLLLEWCCGAHSGLWLSCFISRAPKWLHWTEGDSAIEIVLAVRHGFLVGILSGIAMGPQPGNSLHKHEGPGSSDRANGTYGILAPHWSHSAQTNPEIWLCLKTLVGLKCLWSLGMEYVDCLRSLRRFI